MPSLQRARGDKALIYPTELVKDRRGDRVRVSTDDPIEIRVTIMPERSSRAEVPGQQDIEVVRLICRSDIPGVDVWSRVRWQGLWWDMVSPPIFRRGTRNTRHWSLLVKRRPDQTGGNLKGRDF